MPDPNIYESQYEFDSPFLSEELLTDEMEGGRAQRWSFRWDRAESESPLLNELELHQAEEPELEEKFYSEVEEEFYEEIEEEAEFDEEAEEEAFAELWSDDEEELELEPEVEWERSIFSKKAEGKYLESEIAWNHSHDEEEDFYTDYEHGFEEFRDEAEELEKEALEASVSVLDQDEDFTEELEDSEFVEEEVKLSNKPIPGQFYRIQKGDSLLKIAGEAYGVERGKRRLAFAQFINAQSFNQRYLIKSKSDFIKKYFAGEIISFFPKFSCDANKLIKAKGTPPGGNCFAVIWIPSKRYNYHSSLGQGRSIPVSLLQQELNIGENTENEEKISFLSEKEMQEPPFRWICSLQVVFPDPDNQSRVISFGSINNLPELPATGFLIGSRHILTSAHVVNNWVFSSEGTPFIGEAISATVIPAKRGKKEPPFGIYKAAKRGDKAYFEIPEWWKPIPTSASARFPSSNLVHLSSVHLEYLDYALIKLDSDVDESQIGWWGSPSFSDISEIPTLSATTPTELVEGKIKIEVSGYPKVDLADISDLKKDGVISFKDEVLNQLYSSGKLLKVLPIENPKIFHHTLVTTSGHSGSPIWIKTKKKKSILFGIHSSDSNDGYGVGVILFDKVLDQITKWKKSMGGQ